MRLFYFRKPRIYEHVPVIKVTHVKDFLFLAGALSKIEPDKKNVRVLESYDLFCSVLFSVVKTLSGVVWAKKGWFYCISYLVNQETDMAGIYLSHIRM